jgi:hypothetical protein
VARRSAIPTGRVGAAGEYHVAAELSRRGWLATATIKNAPRTDVLARRLDPPRLISVQTKTTSPGVPAFTPNGSGGEPAAHVDQWMIFCALGFETERPRFWVVPHDVVEG